MPVTDQREPGVYISIEDHSYVSPPVMVGRSVFCVGLCPKGPHNRLVEVTSQEEFQKTFGEPNYKTTSMSHYCMDAAMQYTGRGFYIRPMPDDAKIANVFVTESSSPVQTVGSGSEFTFTEDSKEVDVDATVFDEFVEGNWLYADDGADSNQDARQIVSKDSDNYKYTLNKPYKGSTDGWGTKSASAAKYIPYVSTSKDLAVNAESYMDDPMAVSSDTVYAFYVTGAGSWYNNLKLKGQRVTELEKMYTDEEGNVKYPYMFMRIGVYDENEYGRDRLLEGPWLVSLVRKTPDGMVVRDLASGQVLFIEEKINNNSNLIQMIHGEALDKLSLPDSPSNNIVSEQARLNVMLMMSAGTPVATNMYVDENNALNFANGVDGTTDGQPLYTNAGNLYESEEIWGKVAQAYEASLTSVDGSIEQMKEVTYPWYLPDYIISGGWPSHVQESARFLANYRQDCFHLADTGFKKSYEADLDARLNEYPWNNWTSMLYTQWRRIRDIYTGDRFYITPVYHAIQNHLDVDARYFLAEPVAGIEKGAITDQIKLAYKSNHTERGDLIEEELNPTIYEPDGKYFLQQFTTWKRLSILKRAHAAKFTAYVRKMLPPLLKDILMRKATNFWISQARQRVQNFMDRWVAAQVEAYNVLEWASVSVEFDDTASELNVYVSMKPYRVIERINVFIIVH